MKELQFDVVIVGGGPAGTSTSLSLSQRDPSLKIALLEKTSFEKKRAGEILKPTAQKILQKLGVWHAFLDEKFPPISELSNTWGSRDIPESKTSRPFNQGWRIDRRAFDTFLFNRASQRGISTFQNHTLVNHERNSERYWLLNIQSHNQGEKIFKTPFLVDATGKTLSIASSQGANKIRFDRLVGVSRIFKEQNNSNPVSRLLTEPCSQGWWYSALLPNDQTIASFMTDIDIAEDLKIIKPENWWNLLKKSSNTFSRVKSSTPICDHHVRLADSYRMDILQGEGWASVGDATGRLDPLSAHGNCWAMKSGINATDPIANWIRGDSDALTKYQEQMDREYRQYLIEKMAFYSMEKRWMSSPFWRRRQDIDFMDPFQKEFISNTKQELTEPTNFYFPSSL